MLSILYFHIIATPDPPSTQSQGIVYTSQRIYDTHSVTPMYRFQRLITEALDTERETIDPEVE
jgi:hypothetical protein